VPAVKIDYDKKFDTLYVALTDNANSYGDDSLNDVILLRDIQTEEITGFTILSFYRLYKANMLPHLPPNISCSFEKDILPLVLQ